MNFRFKGEWEPLEGDAGKSSSDPDARVEVAFEGPVVFLLHDTVPRGRLVGVYIDGREYPPLDMSGAGRKGVSTCLASGLSPGKHRLMMKVLLRWKAGTMTVRAVEAAR